LSLGVHSHDDDNSNNQHQLINLNFISRDFSCYFDVFFLSNAEQMTFTDDELCDATDNKHHFENM
jgi:hypothetical protein